MIPQNMSDIFNISYIDRIDNPSGVKKATLTREKLFHVVTREREYKAKKDFPVWSPCIFKGKANNANAIEVSCVVWDIDAGLISFDEMQQHLESTIYNCFMHTTHSHTAKKHKYRVIIPLENPIVAEDWRYAWIASLLHFKWMKKEFVDLACKDARRLYYLGGYSKEDYRVYSQLDRINWDAQPLAYQVFDREEEERLKRKAKMDREFAEYMAVQRRKSGIHRDWNSEQRKKLKCCIDERKHFAQKMSSFGGQIIWSQRTKTKQNVGRVVGFPCPRCHRRDCTYFYIDPSILSAAYCQHRNSCNWFGSLWDLAQHFGIGV